MSSTATMDPTTSLSQPRGNPVVKSSTQVVKSVEFTENNHSRTTLSRRDYTLEETEASWWSHEDNQNISRQCQKEIKEIDDGETFEAKKYCSRGLEGHTRIGSVSKVQTRALAMNAVFDEQFMQWEEGVFDEDTIAEVYCRASSICQLWASLVGRRDYRAAEEIHVSSSKKSSAPQSHDIELTTKECSDKLEQSLVVSCAA
jgi:hypothetical protein